LKRIRLASLSVALIVALSVVGAAVLLLPKSPGSGLPNSCSEPTGGFLIIASKLGFNDSVNHGVPASSWPVVSVKQGQQVDIVVCNTDIEAHGFQIARYHDNSIVSLAPGQVIHVSFVANQAGSFRIYCSIFCSIHAFMQSGLLRVSP
jgi:hypothetical protein